MGLAWLAHPRSRGTWMGRDAPSSGRVAHESTRRVVASLAGLRSDVAVNSASRGPSACLHLRGMRRHLRVGEAERCARLLRRLRGERLDPAEDQTLAVARRSRECVGSGLRGRGERFDVDHLGPEILQGGASFEVAVRGLVRYGGWVLRCVFIYLESGVIWSGTMTSSKPEADRSRLCHRGSWARRCVTTGGPLFAVRLRRRCLVPEEHFYIARPAREINPWSAS